MAVEVGFGDGSVVAAGPISALHCSSSNFTLCYGPCQMGLDLTMSVLIGLPALTTPPPARLSGHIQQDWCHCSSIWWKTLRLPSSVPLPFYSLADMLSVNVCSTFDHPFFSHSPSPTTSIKYLSSVAFCLSLAAFSSPVNSPFSQLCPLPASSTVSPSPRLLLLAMIAALHLLPLLSLCPIIAPFNPAVLCFHSTLLAVSIWVTTSHCASTPVACLQPQAFIFALYHLYLLSTKRLRIIILSTCTFCSSRQPLSNVRKNVRVSTKLLNHTF